MQTFTPKQYMAIDIANSFGLDKLDWNDRIGWFVENEPILLDKLKDAKDPAMFYAGVRAWEDVKAGRPTGYPISLDATASGMQILSVLTGDRKAAELTNVVDTGRRRNAYDELYMAMVRRAQAKSQVGSEDSLKLDYQKVKKAIMTAFYGSWAVPKKVFGEEHLPVFYETLEEEAPYIWELNRAFLAMWNPNTVLYTWVMPDNFHVNIKVMNVVEEDITFMGVPMVTHRRVQQPMPEGRSLGANVTHSVDGFIVRELMRRCSYNPVKVARVSRMLQRGSVSKKLSKTTPMVERLVELHEKSGYLSARILDYIDHTNYDLVDQGALKNLLDSLPPKPFSLLAVHDCFRVHPNYGNDLRQQYNLQLSLIAQSDMLSFLISQVRKRITRINKQGHFAGDILQADYALS